jgi:hypothetical protein
LFSSSSKDDDYEPYSKKWFKIVFYSTKPEIVTDLLFFAEAEHY